MIDNITKEAKCWLHEDGGQKICIEKLEIDVKN